MLSNLVLFAAKAIGTCTPTGGNFFGFPKWYKYLDGVQVESGLGGGTVNNVCNPRITSINDIWLIAAAGAEILLRIAALLAIGIIIYGGIRFVISKGEPDSVANARNTLKDGIIGLVIALSATAVITFVAGRFN